MRILRALFLLLVLANLLLFAAGRGYFGRSGSGEPERLAAQIQPEMIRILRDQAAPQGTQVQPDQPAAAPGTAPPADAGANCLRYEPVGREQAGKIAAKQRARDGGVALAEKRLEEPSSYWVSIPPQPSRQDLDARIAELKSAGVNDFFVIGGEQGANRGAVSLGLFKSERMAESLRERLRAKGVNGVRVSAREAAGAKLAVELRGPAPALTALAADIAAELPDLKPGECPAER
ncbi:MAG TPA: SPOR domain-containing protein [Rhodocyclaceae bacterium]|nr:SPOR domain-containing protein [Rhodocyclaceae bacterium]